MPGNVPLPSHASSLRGFTLVMTYYLFIEMRADSCSPPPPPIRNFRNSQTALLQGNLALNFGPRPVIIMSE
jgi:hypothetical protein